MFSKINLNILSAKERALLKEVSNEDLGKVKTLVVEENVNVNIRDTLKRSPLMRAVVVDDEGVRKEMVSLFIEQGAEVNMVDLHGKSALMMACQEEGKEDVVKSLMECTKTDPNLQDEDGNTALVQAVEVENVEAVRTMLSDDFSSRVDVNVENFSSKTAIVVATKLKNKEICILLASTGKLNLSRVPKHVLSQLPPEAKKEARTSKSRLSRAKSTTSGTPTSKDAPFSFANQISPKDSLKSFTIPTPIPDTEGQEADTRQEKTHSPKEKNATPPSKDQTNSRDQSDQKSPEKAEIRRKESPASTPDQRSRNGSRSSSKSRSKSPPERENAKPTSPKEQIASRSPVLDSPAKSRSSSKSRSKSPPEKRSKSRTSPEEQIAAKLPPIVNKSRPEERDVAEQEPEKPRAVEQLQTVRSQTRQEPRRVSSRMSTASFASEPPRPLHAKQPMQRGWTAAPPGAAAANKWKQRTRERRANRTRVLPLKGKDQQPYVTKSGRVIHPNSVHDKKYEDIQESRALSRISRADMAASQVFLKEDDARSVRSERAARQSQTGRASRVSKISIA